MKNYDELTNDLLERRDRYVADQKKKRKRVMGVATSLCCFCLVAFLSFGMWQGGMFDAKPPITLDDSINIGEKDYINPDELDNSQTTTPGNNDSQGNTQTGTEQKFDPVEIIWTINRVENQVEYPRLRYKRQDQNTQNRIIYNVMDNLVAQNLIDSGILSEREVIDALKKDKLEIPTKEVAKTREIHYVLKDVSTNQSSIKSNEGR